MQAKKDKISRHRSQFLKGARKGGGSCLVKGWSLKESTKEDYKSRHARPMISFTQAIIKGVVWYEEWMNFSWPRRVHCKTTRDHESAQFVIVRPPLFSYESFSFFPFFLRSRKLGLPFLIKVNVHVDKDSGPISTLRICWYNEGQSFLVKNLKTSLRFAQNTRHRINLIYFIFIQIVVSSLSLPKCKVFKMKCLKMPQRRATRESVANDINLHSVILEMQLSNDISDASSARRNIPHGLWMVFFSHGLGEVNEFLGGLRLEPSHHRISHTQAEWISGKRCSSYDVLVMEQGTTSSDKKKNSYNGKFCITDNSCKMKEPFQSVHLPLNSKPSGCSLRQYFYLLNLCPPGEKCVYVAFDFLISTFGLENQYTRMKVTLRERAT